MNIAHPKIGNELAEYVKVLVELPESDWHNFATESLWANPLGKDIFRLENIPFYVYGLSYHDHVIASPSAGFLRFKNVCKRSGHSTYRLFLAENLSKNEFDMAWHPLAGMGCSYEQATKRLLSVDIPPTADIYKAYALLEKAMHNHVWDFEEAHCGHQLTI